MTADNPAQQSAVARLQCAVNDRMEILGTNIGLRRERGFEAVKQSIVGGRSLEAMREVERLTEVIKGQEIRLLTRRTADARASVGWALGTFAVATALVLGLLGTAYSLVRRDVAIRRRSERAVRRSEARKSAILEASMDMIITIDHEGKVVEFNPAAEQTLGRSRGDVIGRELAELIIPPPCAIAIAAA